MMTNRERVLAIMDGKSPDQIPWIPRLELWWLANRNAGTLPEKYQDWRLRDIERDLGVGTPARNGVIFRTKLKGVQKAVQLDGLDTITEYITPIGTVSTVHRRTPELDKAGIYAMPYEEPIKRPEDYDVMTYIVENTKYIPCYEEYEDYERDIGEDGYPMVSVGDTPFHDFVKNYAGYGKGYLDLVDYTDKVERLMETMAQKAREELWPVLAESPARLLLHGVHLSSQMTPPAMFKKYITPHTKEMSEFLHKHNKVLAQHADNDTGRILGDLKEAGWDMQECFATDPLVPTTLKEARDAWGTDMIIFGGIPSIIMEEEFFTDEEFEEYMIDLFRTIAPGDAFILGVSDNVTAPAKLERVSRVTEMIEQYGKYPVSV